MTVAEYNLLEPPQKLVATVMALVHDNDGEILITSGKLEPLKGTQELIWNYDLSTPKIVKIRSEFRSPNDSIKCSNADCKG